VFKYAWFSNVVYLDKDTFGFLFVIYKPLDLSNVSQLSPKKDLKKLWTTDLTCGAAQFVLNKQEKHTKQLEDNTKITKLAEQLKW
jgi:hypothetical protein